MELAVAQLQTLNALLPKLVPGNPFYTQKLETAGGTHFDSLESFSERMPCTTKQELADDHKQNPPFGSTLTYPPGNYTRHHQTSGTSGKPMAWLDTPESWDWVLANWIAVWKGAGAQPGDSACFTFSFGPFLGFWAAFEAATKYRMRAIPAGGLGSAERLKLILRYRPRFLCCTPTYALRLAEVAQQEGVNLAQSGVERIVVGGEPGGSVPEVRARIEQGWAGARVVDHHGMTEVGPVSWSDNDNPDWLRLLHDAYYCEVLQRDSNDPAPPGKCGELVLTTLGRDACPLLRYRTGDWIRPLCVPGEDPRAFVLDGGILGRVDDMVVVRGINLYPSAVDAVVRSMEGIQEYKVTVHQKATLTEVKLTIEPTPGAPAEIADKLHAALRDAFSLRIPVELANSPLPVFEMKARRWHVIHS